MLHFNFANYEGDYSEFTLKKGFFYGYDDVTNEKIATSGWTKDNETTLGLYRLTRGKWLFEWVDLDAAEYIIDAKPNYKLLFIDWLCSHYNLTFEEWQKMNDSDSLEIRNEFLNYYDNILLREE